MGREPGGGAGRTEVPDGMAGWRHLVRFDTGLPGRSPERLHLRGPARRSGLADGMAASPSLPHSCRTPVRRRLDRLSHCRLSLPASASGRPVRPPGIPRRRYRRTRFLAAHRRRFRDGRFPRPAAAGRLGGGYRPMHHPATSGERYHPPRRMGGFLPVQSHLVLCAAPPVPAPAGPGHPQDSRFHRRANGPERPPGD